ncbi:MAG: bifunctional D-glycero-beta-D-manno-heptose-7-phosphate kinase/D-glycero-beta-D-manno-heptose 1-phosphate adenylyltransferase HldE [Pseudomonadales bacterium]|jgi:D-beta-D-heptose 7-phosphate kinase/D-beta-D-heptose 1-phosphate adenosyltransferase|nr:bifunctional D-glycero-beta-D-manno-heptose-7-phosphate kinase/D-glycero-beta-D-manno-heptose 1-phosphate adenylyltransferase HldE [Pseudomonadales bacterium]MDP7595539.1 bifunctional D-glycero-beta-D-manno-heptose-7-phosphate kinase/D-glycero-beta-D-manno-heptose 1-phosphate adenylyltransferase HldE [Pseudomonadales bacterium]HJN50906.1 bifunctional D-glycero-beta-D-manno-heptose-7-phosphate kinase/D-glycero-beta-D-manno-heptose 1-phosphate adenylyltransferase HldE [Pseudomonadales bacterium]|tara:strand:+ start:1324 stop:2745 length:1422 start_codon:yes stop_codon:yes gene_type:complete
MSLKIPGFSNTRVLIVGDAMLDRYWHGDATEVSAEAPVPVIKVNEIEHRPGGAANVALNLSALGSASVLIAMVGRDEAGKMLQAKLETSGVICDLPSTAESRTITKLRIISRNQQLLRADFETNMSLDSEEILSRMENCIDKVDTIILSDYDKGTLTDPQSIISLADSRQIPVLVDPKFKDFSVYRGAMVVKPNRRELQKAIGPWQSEKEMAEKSERLIRDHQIEALLVTQGGQGMTLIRPGMQEMHFPARSREVFDVTGAGDTSIAVLAASLAAGKSLVDSIALANIAGGMVVTHAGTVSISAPELRHEVAAEFDFEKGVLSEEQLVVAVESARSNGEKIVFTNGCFDILHAGHVDYLSEARTLGSRLIVAVNDDESVRRLKGEGRPINQVERRMIILAALESVDWVVPFSEDTPERLLDRIKPEVLVKGGDYKLGEVVGADIVKRYNGDVKVLKFVDHSSTSDLVEKIREL